MVDDDVGQGVEKALGYTFTDKALLIEALTHSTFANENPRSGPDNERLELVGDAVLDLLVARILYQTLECAREGELSRRRANVVCGSSLCELADDLDLGAHLMLGAGQHSSAAPLSSRTLADTYEAVVGAVFMDGGFAAVERCFTEPMKQALQERSDEQEFKTRLQEACHRLGKVAPSYEVVSVDGPDHARRYLCRVAIDGQEYGAAAASSKKGAEQLCAEKALAAFEEPSP